MAPVSSPDPEIKFDKVDIKSSSAYFFLELTSVEDDWWIEKARRIKFKFNFSDQTISQVSNPSSWEDYFTF